MARPPRWLVVTSVLGALALGAAGAWFYLAQRQYLEQTASANLLAIAQDKLDRDRRLADRARSATPRSSRKTRSSFGPSHGGWRGTGPRSPPTSSRDSAAPGTTTGTSTCVWSIGPDASSWRRAGAGVPSTRPRPRPSVPRSAIGVRRSGDVYVSRGDSFPHLAVVAPLLAPGGRAAEPMGAVVLVVDARRSLFRLVESWPSPSPSAEAALVRRDGDSALFLTAPRLQPGAALTRRVPLSRKDVPAVMAVLGTEGVMRGVDYRGVGCSGGAPAGAGHAVVPGG